MRLSTDAIGLWALLTRQQRCHCRRMSSTENVSLVLSWVSTTVESVEQPPPEYKREDIENGCQVAILLSFYNLFSRPHLAQQIQL